MTIPKMRRVKNTSPSAAIDRSTSTTMASCPSANAVSFGVVGVPMRRRLPPPRAPMTQISWSPLELFWYAIAGIPGLVLFKVVSTMDSMVGYKTPQYLRFGWCGARLDDVMNFVPARVTWLLIALAAVVIPGCSAHKALRIGWRQHALLPGPNSGWSEAATAGAIQGRLVGPIRVNGSLVTDAWLGDPADPPVESARTFSLAIVVTVATAAIASALAVGYLASAPGALTSY